MHAAAPLFRVGVAARHPSSLVGAAGVVQECLALRVDFDRVITAYKCQPLCKFWARSVGDLAAKDLMQERAGWTLDVDAHRLAAGNWPSP